VARARYAVGQGAQPDVLRVQTEVTRIEQRVIEQAAEAEVRVRRAQPAAGETARHADRHDARLALMPLAESAEEALAQARAVSPELRGAALAIEASTAAAALARRDLKPDFSIQAGYMNRGGLDAMWLAGIGIAWPFNKKARESAVAEARSARRAATTSSSRSGCNWRTEPANASPARNRWRSSSRCTTEASFRRTR